MDEREFRDEYKRVFNNIHASAELLEKIKTQKQPKRNFKPYIAAAASAAAAFMIFAAVHDYNFDNNNDDGVISETRIAETEKPAATERAKAQTEPEKSTEKDSTTDTAVAGDNVTSTKKPEKKTTQDYMKEALEKSGATKQSEYKAPVITSKPDSGNTADSTRSGSSYPAEPVPEKTQAAAAESSAVSEQSNSYSETSAPEYKASVSLRINKAAETSEKTTKFFNNPEENDGQAVSEAASADAAPSEGYASNGGTLYGSSGGSSSAIMPGGGGGSFSAPASVAASVEWDNDRYFEYIGVDLKAKIELCADVEYTGDDTAYFMVDQNGDLLNDLRTFTFRGENGICINVETTRSTDSVQSIIDDESFEKSDIEGTSAVVIDTDGTYRCYMIFKGTSYTIDASGITEDGLGDILLSIVS